MVLEQRYDLDDKGRLVIRSARISLDRNLRFAFRFYAETYALQYQLDTSTQWWDALMRCNRIRDRLMHPRSPEDLNMTPKEIVDAVAAERGFTRAVTQLVRQK